MDWDHAVSWGRRVWFALAILVGLALPEVVGWPTEIEKKTQKTRVSLFGLGDGSTETHMCDK